MEDGTVAELTDRTDLAAAAAAPGTTLVTAVDVEGCFTYCFTFIPSVVVVPRKDSEYQDDHVCGCVVCGAKRTAAKARMAETRQYTLAMVHRLVVVVPL